MVMVSCGEWFDLILVICWYRYLGTCTCLVVCVLTGDFEF